MFAPCVFTFLPVVLSGSGSQTGWRKPAVILVSLGGSVFLFTLLLRASTLLITIPQNVWELVAGGIILVQGLLVVFPGVWDKFVGWARLNQTNGWLGTSSNVLTGAALGPIFSACSPTYGFIVGALLQATVGVGLVYLSIYILGLVTMLMLIALLGQRLVARLKWGINPHGVFKRVVGVVFIVMGLLIMTGGHKKLETWIIDTLPGLDSTRIDLMLLEQALPDGSS